MKTARSALYLALLATFSPSLLASTAHPQLEEVYVTAQKRQQTAREVPVSLQAISGEQLNSRHLTGIEQMSDYLPGLSMSQTGIGTHIAIRGIASGVNQGFEQSAAQFVDGIHYGRAQLSRAPLLDVERVEVLKGPQSILFGKNSTAGAISITTAKPGQNREGELRVLHEPEHGETDVRFVVSGPISDNLSARFAALDRRMDGYYHNTTLGRDESGDIEQLYRLSLNWTPNDWQILLKAEKGRFDSEGRNIEVVQPVLNPHTGRSPVQYASVLSALTQGKYQLDTRQDFKRQSNGDFSYNDTENITLTIEKMLGEYLLSATTGFNAYRYDEWCDCDFTGAQGFNIVSNENYRQTSQEIRIASAEDQPFSYLGGIFYQHSTLDFHDDVQVPVDSVIPVAMRGTLPIAHLLAGASTQRNFDQQSDIAALFGQATWQFQPHSKLIIGARYTQESKSASRHQYHMNEDGHPLPQGGVDDDYNRLWSIFKIDPHQIKGKRNESGFTPLITLQHDLNTTDRLYLSYTTGYKSGGFDVRSNAAPNALGGVYNGPSPLTNIEGTWEFGEEKVRNYEWGGKFVFADGAADMNIALFRSEFRDLQTSQFDGSLSFNVANAGEAVVQGVELETRYALTERWMLHGALTWLDFEYRHFPNGQCYFGQPDNIAPFGDGVCDATGLRKEFTPEYQGYAGIDYQRGLNNGWRFSHSLDLIYSDRYFTTPSLDPRMVQSAYVKLNARIALAAADDRWELALIGKNLTSERVIRYANGLPVANILTQGTGSGFYAFYERPASVALQGTIRF